MHQALWVHQIFKSFVGDIHTHGNPRVGFYRPRDGLYQHVPADSSSIPILINENGKYYVNANLLRDQSGEVLGYHDLGLVPTEYSITGAAKTVTLMFSQIKHESAIAMGCLSIWPDIELDYVPQLTIPYQYLPDNLRKWQDRSTDWPPEEINEKIMAAGGVMVAKNLHKSDEHSSIYL